MPVQTAMRDNVEQSKKVGRYLDVCEGNEFQASRYFTSHHHSHSHAPNWLLSCRCRLPRKRTANYMGRGDFLSFLISHLFALGKKLMAEAQLKGFRSS